MGLSFLQLYKRRFSEVFKALPNTNERSSGEISCNEISKEELGVLGLRK